MTSTVRCRVPAPALMPLACVAALLTLSAWAESTTGHSSAGARPRTC